ncbi:MAG: class I SAM-dependent methyltransferase [Chloroflexota bacterium]
MASRAAPERMADFFDARASGYEEHMRRSVADFARFYESVAGAVARTNRAVRILDIGCGTGLELEAIVTRAPNARITALDVSAGMLRELRKRYEARVDQFEVIQGSYLELPLGEERYQYVVAVMTLHHLLPARKRALYRKVRKALGPGGTYIEGDWVVSRDEEGGQISHCGESGEAQERALDGRYHIDVPLSVDTERRLLLEAGFSSVDEVWHSDSTAVFAARD